ncbi:MAG TPA: histidine phosphatase family protein [Gaiellaceae bacterium]|nr:histidine phosphatase family protein [Gaiellaceae bacterium]
MELLILARHGETDWNTRRLVNGDPAVDVRLSERGREEARRLGTELAGEQLDLCVTSAFPRTEETAALALDGRVLPRLRVADLGDPGYGSFEGGHLDDYRAWAAKHDSTAAPDGGEPRHAVVGRYVRGFRLLLARPERTILAVLHSLPIAYALAAREGRAPEPREPLVANAHPYRFAHEELDRAIGLLEGWCASPTW